MHVEFIRDHNFRPKGTVPMTIAFKAGRRYPVKRAWGEKMIAEGACREVATPRRRSSDANRG